MVAVGGNGGEADGAGEGEVCASARLQVTIVPRARAPQAKAMREDDLSDYMFAPETAKITIFAWLEYRLAKRATAILGSPAKRPANL